MMRWFAAFLCLGAAGCAASDPPLPTPDPPTAAAIATWAGNIAKEYKLPPPIEVSSARAAHPLALGDWIVCVKSAAAGQRLRYAVFFRKDFLMSHIAIGTDRCDQETYVALPSPPPPPPAPPPPTAPPPKP